MHDDEGGRARHLDQPGADKEMPRVVGVDQATHQTGEKEERDDPGAEQDAYLVGPGTVGLEAEGEGDECHPVAEGRHHPPREGDK